MYSVSGLTLPMTLAPGAHFTLTVKFTPLATGTFNGRIVFGSNATNSLVYYGLSGTGTALTITPNDANFGSVPIGTTVSQSEQLKNTGNTAVTLIGVTKYGGPEFRLCNLTYPISLAAGQALNCTLGFAPTSLGTVSGSVTFTSSPAGSATVTLTATGVSGSKTISAVPSSLSFGNVTVGKSETLAVKIENTGNSNVTVSGLSVSSVGITTTGGVSGATIAPGQSATLNVTFTPAKTETVSGSVTVTSNATNSPTKIAFSGSGVAGVAHFVTLRWTRSPPSGIVGYNVYRATLPGTTYSKIMTLVTGTSYEDSAVAAGETYSYKVTAVNTQGEESAPAGPVPATVP